MEDKRYNLFYSGKITEGNELEQVKKNIINLANLNENDPAYKNLVDGKTISIKKNIDLETVKKYQSAFKKVGAILDVKAAEKSSNANANANANSITTSLENKDSPKRKKDLFKKITTEEEAQRIIKEAFIVFIGVSILTALIGYFVMPDLLFDAAFFGLLGISLKVWKSRFVAGLLIFYTGLVIISTILNIIGVTQVGGSNIILSVILFYLSIRAFQATSVLTKLKPEEAEGELSNKKAGWFAITFCIIILIINSFLILSIEEGFNDIIGLIAYIGGAAVFAPLIIAKLFCIRKKHRNSSRLVNTFNVVSFLMTLSLLMQVGQKFGSVDYQTSESTIDNAKNATVFISVSSGNSIQTGTGFLISKINNEGLIVTNSHVIDTPHNKNRKVNVVFNSGTNKAYTLDATVIGNNVASDLAILVIEHNDLPKPIPLNINNLSSETEQLFIVGFPFGTDFKTNRETPIVTVSKGSISSQRLDENDQPFLLQIDGDINPGNSGGPIVNSKGQLQGVSVSTIKQTNIAFAIPPFIIKYMLDGILTNILIEKDGSEYIISADKIDPFQNIKSSSLLISTTSTHDIDKYKGDDFSWHKLEDVIETVEFKPNESYLSAIFKIPSSKTRSILHGQVVLNTTSGDKFLPPFQIYSDSNTVELAGPNIVQLIEEDKSKNEKPKSSPPNEKKTIPAPTPEDIPLVEVEPDSKQGIYIYTDNSIENILATGNGKELVLRLSDEPQISIFNTVNEKITQRLKLDIYDYYLAVNKNYLFIIDRENKRINRHDLKDITKSESRSLNLPGEVTAVTVGSNSNDSPLILLANQNFYFIDPKTLLQKEYTWNMDRGNSNGPRINSKDKIKLRASPDGKYFTFWGTQYSPAGVNLIRIQGNSLKHKNEHKTAGYLAPIDSGTVLTDQDGIYSNQLTQIGHDEMKRKHLIPVLGEKLLIKVNWDRKNTTAGVYRIRGNKLEFDFEKLHDMNVSKHPMAFYKETITPDKRYYWYPESKKLITIPYSNDKIAIYKYE